MSVDDDGFPVRNIDPFTGEVLDPHYPAFNVYTGRDTSGYALLFEGDDAVSRTQQEHAADADINNIMARYVKTGMVPMYVDRMMLDGDQHHMSFAEMMNVIADGKSAFMALPSGIREKFDNDPAKFIDFAADEANKPQLKEWGLLSPEAVQRLDSEAAAQAAEKQLADQEALESRLSARLAERSKAPTQ